MLLAEVGLPASPALVARTHERLVARTATLLAAGVDWLPGAPGPLHAVRASGVPPRWSPTPAGSSRSWHSTGSGGSSST